MDSGVFVTPNEVLFMAAGMAGDKDYKVIPRGFYLALIQEAFNDLNIASLFADRRVDFPMPSDTLTLQLPSDCIGVKNVYVFTGDACTRSNSRKVWWKRNYFTEGNGFIANDTGRNAGDPFYNQRSFSTSREDKNLIRVNGPDGINSILYYEVENMNLMLSSSCVGAGNKVHLAYKSSGGELGDAPVIPLMFKTAIQDFVVEAALRFRMANEPSMARVWIASQQIYERRLDKSGFNGSWHEAIMNARSMSPGKRADLATYLGKAAWATGR